MTDTGPTADKAVYKVFIEAPIEAVWRGLVKTDEVLPFFFGSVCKTTGELTVGAPIAMETTNGKYRSVVGKVIEFDPPNRYSHTFKFTGYDDPPCTVTYELEAVAGGTEFSLVTTNVPAGTKTEKGMAQGGKMIVDTLKSVVETGKPALGTRMLLGVMGLMQPFTPKACRSDNWSFDRIEKL
ncbi:SRPBCC domain-containing protein [uncultured Erythrobacter sp.]|uniref:SRPBCC domain-containing protein n=1 Tax=uncultured Erythrobacter sp. TaxID=263913 RepID=UPI00261D79EA|nr:SRPBCC domain-containing protein [uncultured Erythrobacter sp.]